MFSLQPPLKVFILLLLKNIKLVNWWEISPYTVTPIYTIKITITVTQKQLKKTRTQNLLFAVGQFAIFSHSHGLLLNVVLREKSRLTSDHLHDGSWNDHLFNGLIGASGLPLFRRNDLEVNQRQNCGMRRWDQSAFNTGDQSLQVQCHKIWQSIHVGFKNLLKLCSSSCHEEEIISWPNS